MTLLLLACTGGDVPALTLADASGGRWELRGTSEPYVVFTAHGVGCPIVQRYSKTLQELHLRENVRFFLVNGQDPADKVRAETEDFGVEAPVLMDEDQALTRTFGFTRTSETVLVDTRSWEVRYHGAIDDRLDYGAERPGTTNTWLLDAVEALEAGQPVPVERTEAKGCALYLR